MPTTTNYGWTTPADTDLVKDGASAIRTLGNGVDTTVKNLNPETTLGDISYRSSTANTNTRLGIGTTGQVLTVSGGVPVWSTPAGGGKVLQVISVAKTDTFSVASQTFTDVTDLTVSITPSSATSKILVLHQLSTGCDPSTTIMQARLLRDATIINAGATAGNRTLGFMSFAGAASTQMVQSGAFLDSPATTSSLTYKIQVRATHSSATVYVNRSAGDEDNGERSRQASTITVLEIGA